jgi:hypothetical protein
VHLNPRPGTEYVFSVEDLASRISGKAAPELFHEVAEFLLALENTHQGP